MEIITGILKFNEDFNCYGLADSVGNWRHPEGLDWYVLDNINCGSTLQVKVGNKWVDTRIEKKDQEWYLVGTKFRGNLTGVGAKIKY